MRCPRSSSRTRILPRFREGDFAGGIKNGVRDIALVLTGDAAEVEARAKARKMPTSA